LVAAKDKNWLEEGKVLETMGNINIMIIIVDILLKQDKSTQERC